MHILKCDLTHDGMDRHTDSGSMYVCMYVCIFVGCYLAINLCGFGFGFGFYRVA